MIWRLRGEEAEIGPRDLAWRRKIALTVLATAFWIVVAFILFEAVAKLHLAGDAELLLARHRHLGCGPGGQPVPGLAQVPLRQEARRAVAQVRRQGHPDLPVPDYRRAGGAYPDAHHGMVVGRSRRGSRHCPVRGLGGASRRPGMHGTWTPTTFGTRRIDSPATVRARPAALALDHVAPEASRTCHPANCGANNRPPSSQA